MIDFNSNKVRTFLGVSVIANIFLVAFIAGRVSMIAMMPPPPPPPPPAPHQMMPHTESQHFGPQHFGPQAGGHPQDGAFADMPPPPPPPMFGPAELFTPEELRNDLESMKSKFDEVRQMRKDFAHKLEQGPVTKEEVLAHFEQVETLMNSIRSQTQHKLADKMSQLSDEERKRFAKRFARHGPGHHKPPHHGHRRHHQP